jgi:hypothetical protein
MSADSNDPVYRALVDKLEDARQRLAEMHRVQLVFLAIGFLAGTFTIPVLRWLGFDLRRWATGRGDRCASSVPRSWRTPSGVGQRFPLGLAVHGA